MSASETEYLIKTFGARLEDFRFFRFPNVVERARVAFSGEPIMGVLICALIRQPRLTGLMFCDRRRRFPEGLPIRTPPLTGHYEMHGYPLYVTEGGGHWVVAHWLHENGEIGPFYSVQ